MSHVLSALSQAAGVEGEAKSVQWSPRWGGGGRYNAPSKHRYCNADKPGAQSLVLHRPILALFITTLIKRRTTHDTVDHENEDKEKCLF